MMPEAPRCIYSGVPLDPERFALDHFLPWTFVGHDALWNLIPVLPEANSAKGNRLAHRAYVDGLVTLQQQGLVATMNCPPSRIWETASAIFSGDLHMAVEDVIDAEALASAYVGALEPQLAIAKAIGFEADWRFSN